MKLKRRPNFRNIFISLYFVAFVIYLVVGLQPAEAANYQVDAMLRIPSIGLESDVTKLELENYELNTPDEIVGSFRRAENKTLLIGHSSTVFTNLDQTKLNDIIIYNQKLYRVNKIETKLKSEISMADILASSKKDTIVLMTCAGEKIGEKDATHRLIITASKL